MARKPSRAAVLTSRNDVNKAVEKLARKNKVKIVQPELRIEDPKATLAEVAKIPREAELACMKSTLDRLEFDLALARERAEDWSLGDVAGLRSSNALAQQETCWSALMQKPAGCRYPTSVRRAMVAARLRLSREPYDFFGGGADHGAF